MTPLYEMRLQQAKLLADAFRALWSWLRKRWARK